MQDLNYKPARASGLLTTEAQITTNLTVEYSVSEVSAAIKRAVEENFTYIRVKGEISGLKIAASGHAYFNLKDNNSVLACTCWKHAMAKINIKLEEGLEVVVTGKVTTYAGQSKYQMSVEIIEIAGVGALMLQFERLKQLFISEGLFAPERKKSLPFMPLTIGVITSMAGAVICDIMHRIKARCPVRVIIWPVAVQGINSAAEIVEAINGFNAYQHLNIPAVELIIVARGGGSIEDLWSFNEEIVVRATANSTIPVVSAVGHETDTTLIDFAADLRAPTPTAAAELIVPVLSQLRDKSLELNYRMHNAINKLLNLHEHLLNAHSSKLPKPVELILNQEQRLDELYLRLRDSLPKLVNIKILLLNRLPIGLLDPRRNMLIKQQKLNNISNNLHVVLNQRIQRQAARLALLSCTFKLNNLQQNLKLKQTSHAKLAEQLDKITYRLLEWQANKLINFNNLLNSLNYKQVLKRGFAIISAEKKIISSATQLTAGEINIEFYDGKKTAKIY